MISIDGQIIGKPRDSENAFAILKSLDGRKHSVRTGVCLISSCGHEELFSIETEVEFGQLGDRLIREYVATGEPMYVLYNTVCPYVMHGVKDLKKIKGAELALMLSRRKAQSL
jgi:predicted house-cleaning NTP pyrophosphatase (Maf/HAM1 superfamily)